MQIMFIAACLLLLPAVFAVNSDKSDVEWVQLNSTTKGTNTYSEAIYYGQTHPTRDGGSWSGW